VKKTNTSELQTSSENQKDRRRFSGRNQ